MSLGGQQNMTLYLLFCSLVMHFPILGLRDDDNAHILLVLITADSVHEHLLLLQFVGGISKPVVGSICTRKSRLLFLPGMVVHQGPTPHYYLSRRMQLQSCEKYEVTEVGHQISSTSSRMAVRHAAASR